MILQRKGQPLPQEDPLLKVSIVYFAVILIIPDGNKAGDDSGVIIDEGNKYSSNNCNTSFSEHSLLSIPVRIQEKHQYMCTRRRIHVHVQWNLC